MSSTSASPQKSNRILALKQMYKGLGQLLLNLLMILFKFCKVFNIVFKVRILTSPKRNEVFGFCKRGTPYKVELHKIQCSCKLNLELSSQNLQALQITTCTGTLGLHSQYDFL